MNLARFSTAMDGVAWRGLVYSVFILHFVFACQLLLLQPLVSALGLWLSRFDLFTWIFFPLLGLKSMLFFLIYFRCIQFLFSRSSSRCLGSGSPNPDKKKSLFLGNLIPFFFFFFLFCDYLFYEQCLPS
jgi:hypothetical protein